MTDSFIAVKIKVFQKNFIAPLRRKIQSFKNKDRDRDQFTDSTTAQRRASPGVCPWRDPARQHPS